MFWYIIFSYHPKSPNWQSNIIIVTDITGYNGYLFATS